MIRLAKKAAQKSKVNQKVGAVIVKGGRALAHAHNSRKSCPNFGSGKYSTLHAESAVIKKCIRSGINLSGATIMVYRNGGERGLLSKPCDCCMTLIEAVGIKKVIYSDDGELKEIKL